MTMSLTLMGHCERIMRARVPFFFTYINACVLLHNYAHYSLFAIELRSASSWSLVIEAIL